jgi:Cdc25 family phosphatase
MMPTLVRRLRSKQTVVFHCMLSQQRGPGAALRYIREREEILRSQPGGTTKEDGEQVVYVLDRGFSGWQQEYAEDERLTEGYRKELWVGEYTGH